MGWDSTDGVAYLVGIDIAYFSLADADNVRRHALPVVSSIAVEGMFYRTVD
jgi:hypothetical protein